MDNSAYQHGKNSYGGFAINPFPINSNEYRCFQRGYEDAKYMAESTEGELARMETKVWSDE